MDAETHSPLSGESHLAFLPTACLAVRGGVAACDRCAVACPVGVLKVGADGTAHNTALALILFTFVLPVFAFPLTPLFSWWSRRHEFEADAFAACESDARALIEALVKLYRENAATLTPDPLYALFHASHPPAAERIAHLASLKESSAC